ncbi:LysR family transcriptional regulator [Rhodococcus sp. ABRD24]|uniref:LysR family transcriptional regulator n=1 Tax=Rhodococcus sp. ABRD24 TaxID=2507582 RepID=UPI0013F1462F|nr:LysR family transcriptional regulator [Rhodococcus sp. ABRD24]
MHRLQVLIAIVETGGFSAAARVLPLSQSTVSSHIRQLEIEVGATLFDRSTSVAKLTPEGEILLEYAYSVVSLGQAALDRVNRSAPGPVAGELRVGGSTTAGARVFPDLLARFADLYPQVSIEFIVANVADLTQRVCDGETSVAVVAGSPSHPSLETTHILDEEHLLVAAPTHPLAGSHATASLLRGSRFLLREAGSNTRRYQEEALGHWRIRDLSTSTVESTHAIVACVAAGLGLAIVPESAAADALASGRIAAIQMSPSPPTRSINLIHRRGHPLTRPEELFVKMAPLAGAEIREGKVDR